MNVYVYQAALLCEDCGKAERARIESETGISRELLETGVGSDGYPDGPFSDGGGEADTAQHCDHCAAPLDNPVIPRALVASAIEWDTDGESVDLPESVTLPIGVDQDDAADWLSDRYGFCVASLDVSHAA